MKSKKYKLLIITALFSMLTSCNSYTNSTFRAVAEKIAEYQVSDNNRYYYPTDDNFEINKTTYYIKFWKNNVDKTINSNKTPEIVLYLYSSFYASDRTVIRERYYFVLHGESSLYKNGELGAGTYELLMGNEESTIIKCVSTFYKNWDTTKHLDIEKYNINKLTYLYFDEEYYEEINTKLFITSLKIFSDLIRDVGKDPEKVGIRL